MPSFYLTSCWRGTSNLPVSQSGESAGVFFSKLLYATMPEIRKQINAILDVSEIYLAGKFHVKKLVKRQQSKAPGGTGVWEDPHILHDLGLASGLRHLLKKPLTRFTIWCAFRYYLFMICIYINVAFCRWGCHNKAQHGRQEDNEGRSHDLIETSNSKKNWRLFESSIQKNSKTSYLSQFLFNQELKPLETASCFICFLVPWAAAQLRVMPCKKEMTPPALRICSEASFGEACSRGGQSMFNG